MRELAENLWVAEQPLRFGVVELGARMTVMRLADSSIVLHSPISLTDSLKSELDSIGTVRDVIAPNRFHHLFVGDYSAAYPESALYVAPGLPEKRAAIRIEATRWARTHPRERSPPYRRQRDRGSG